PLAVALAAACSGVTGPGVSSRVRFVIDAPFCGNAYPVNFYVDGVQVGRDTMWFGVGADTSPAGAKGSQRFKAYQSFEVRPGSHTVRAAIVDTTPLFQPLVYVWPDTTITVAASAEAVRKLPFYCS